MSPFFSYLYGVGKSVWKKWKKRYYVLVQVSQYTFALCTYKEKKTEPAEMMQLDGYTVDYIEPASGKLRITIESRLSPNSIGIEEMCNGYLPFPVSSFASQVMPGQGKLLFSCINTFLTIELLPHLFYLTCMGLCCSGS